MNTSIKAMRQHIVTIRLTDVLPRISYDQLALQSVLMVLLFSLFMMIYVVNQSRSYTDGILQGRKHQISMNTQYNQLLLEKETFSSEAHVQDVAKKHLHMQQLKPSKVIVLTS